MRTGVDQAGKITKIDTIMAISTLVQPRSKDLNIENDDIEVRVEERTLV